MDTTGYDLSLRHMVMNLNCNSTSNLFGGQMLAWIDEGAAMYASCQMGRDELVTRHIAGIDFKLPIPRGWTCTVYCRTLKEGRTSIVVDVLVTRKSNSRHIEELVTTTQVVFVAVNADGVAVEWTKSNGQD